MVRDDEQNWRPTGVCGEMGKHAAGLTVSARKCHGEGTADEQAGNGTQGQNAPGLPDKAGQKHQRKPDTQHDRQVKRAAHHV